MSLAQAEVGVLDPGDDLIDRNGRRRQKERTNSATFSAIRRCINYD
jgi:hypothetical protein